MLKLSDVDEIVLDLSDYRKLAPGEYNIRFKYINYETPSMPIEIYDRSRVKRQ